MCGLNLGLHGSLCLESRPISWDLDSRIASFYFKDTVSYLSFNVNSCKFFVKWNTVRFVRPNNLKSILGKQKETY